MKTMLFKSSKTILSVSMLFLLFVSGCERSVDGLDEPAFSTDPNVFLDGFSGGLEYAAFGNSVVTAFQVDTDVTFNNSQASMRFEVPDADDPRGLFAGGVFFTTVPRDLSEYDALTFYARSSAPIEIGELGFGNDLGANTLVTSINNTALNSNWQKYVIPIPDPAKLNENSGMLFYAAAPDADGKGYTFWLDEVKYERLGTSRLINAQILNGEDRETTSFATITTQISEVSSVFNLPNGTDISVNLTPAYFNYTSNNESAATVAVDGTVTVGSADSALVTATLQGQQVDGSLKVVSRGVYVNAPTPTEAAADVISIFSDSYEDRPVDFYNGFYAPFQTTTSADFEVGGDNVLNYENFNFVGIEFNQGVPTIDATDMSELTVDVFVPVDIPANAQFRVVLVDFGANQSFGGGDDTQATVTVTQAGGDLVSGQWIEMTLDLAGLPVRNNLGQIVFDSPVPGGPVPSNVYVDNIYLRR